MSVLTQIGSLFLLMGVGFALGKLKLLDSPAIKGLSNLVIKAALPALILTSLQRPFSRELLDGALQTLLVATLYYIGIMALAFGAIKLLRTPRRQVGALVFSLTFSNSGFVGFPVVVSILGPGALFLAAIHNILFNLLAFSLGIAVVSGTSAPSGAEGGGSATANASALAGFRFPWMRMLNINVIAALVGFVLFLFSVTLPRALALPLEMLGGVTTPLAMLVVGAMLARTPIRSVVGDWRLYAVAALRLLVWPLLAGLACAAFGIGGDLFAITVIVAGMPAASNTGLIAEIYGGDTDTASSVIFLTTLLSVVTIPVMAIILT